MLSGPFRGPSPLEASGNVADRARKRKQTAAASLLVFFLYSFVAVLSSFGAEARTEPPAVVKVFTLRYRRAEDALLLIRPLLTERGSVILESKLNSLTVRDSSAAVERTAQALASYDIPPRSVDIEVTLLKATSDPRQKADKQDVPQEIRSIGERLKKLLSFTDYSRLDSIVVRGTEGDRVAAVMGADYRLEFLLDPTADERMVRLKGLTLERLRSDGAGKEVRREILKTTINLSIGQPYILGVGKDESASGALFLVFSANWRRPGPGIF
jgi:hypothetical protein